MLECLPSSGPGFYQKQDLGPAHVTRQTDGKIRQHHTRTFFDQILQLDLQLAPVAAQQPHPPHSSPDKAALAVANCFAALPRGASWQPQRKAYGQVLAHLLLLRGMRRVAERPGVPSVWPPLLGHLSSFLTAWQPPPKLRPLLIINAMALVEQLVEGTPRRRQRRPSWRTAPSPQQAPPTPQPAS